MSHSIRITVGGVALSAELNNSPTAEAMLDSLPLEASVNRWGDEFYFSTPIEAELEDGAKAEVDVGTIAFWPPGNAFCIFFGPTPASSGLMPCAASPVNVIGRLLESLDPLHEVANGAPILIEATDDS